MQTINRQEMRSFMSTSYAAMRHAEREQAALQVRERVLALHSEGHTPKQIAQRVQISKREVKEIIASAES